MFEADASVVLKWENDVDNWEVSETKEPFTFDEIIEFIQLPQDINLNQQLRLMICDNISKKPIGCIDLFEYEQNKSVGVGVLTADKPDRNKGLATQSLELIIDYCRNELEIAYIFCNIFRNNKASIRLFENCGFKFIEERKLNQRQVNYYELKLI